MAEPTASPESSPPPPTADAARTTDPSVGDALTEVGGGGEADVSTAADEDDEWMDVLGSGTLRKKVVRAGRGRDTRPQRGEIVVFTLRVTVDGALVEGGLPTTEPRTVMVGEHDDALALDLILPLMELGEVAKVVTTPRYDNRAVPSPTSSIEYAIELLRVEPGIEVSDMGLELRLSRAQSKKERANELYGRGLHDDAVGQLQRAVTYLTDGVTDPTDEVHALTAVCWTNLAAALLKLPNTREAIKACDAALVLQPTNEKALFRKARALTEIKEYSAAREVLTALLKTSPSNGAALKLVGLVRRKQQDEKAIERALAKRMVSGLDGTSKEQRKTDAAAAKVAPKVKKSPAPHVSVILCGLCMVAVVCYLIIMKATSEEHPTDSFDGVDAFEEDPFPDDEL